VNSNLSGTFLKAVVIDESRSDRPLILREVPDPQPGEHDLLVAVRAAALNRADLRRAATHFASSEQHGAAAIAGLELAGEVIAIGARVSGFVPGDHIMAMAGGAYAERAVVDHRLAIPVPSSMNWQQAAATPITFVTGYDALASAAEFKPGETLLVQGASTGVGIAVIQIARSLGAKTIFGTSSVPDKLRRLADLGCDVPIDYRSESFVAVVNEKTAKRGVDVVIDLVGATTAQGNIDAATVRGRIICVGRVGGLEATINLDEFARKRIRMTGVTFRTRSLDERTQVVRQFIAEMLPKLASGAIRPVIDSTYPLAEAGAAQDYMRSNKHFGKIILTL
jgi:NADPH2:quinone reductase